jgi:hypothetical protein
MVVTVCGVGSGGGSGGGRLVVEEVWCWWCMVAAEDWRRWWWCTCTDYGAHTDVDSVANTFDGSEERQWPCEPRVSNISPNTCKRKRNAGRPVWCGEYASEPIKLCAPA